MSTSSSPSTPSTLVGRDRELDVLRDHLAAALAGRGSLVLISGEAGIGKTALAEALCRDATEQDSLILTGRCYDLTETPPYGPWVEVFGRFHRHDGMPPLPNAFAQRGTVGAVASQAALFQQVLDFLSIVGAHNPLVLLLDDLHWADPASLDLLRVIARSLEALPILLLVTYRSDELTRQHPLHTLLPLLVREAHTERCDLRSLTARDLEHLVETHYHLGSADAARLIAYLQQRAEGNPFFLGELTRTLEEEMALHSTATGWSLGDLTAIGVPPLLRQVLERRIARLGEDAQRLLTLAAVIGQEVPLALWATLAELDHTALMTVIEKAVDARLLAETPDGTRARFVHALIREALYESILPSRRLMQHRQVAELLCTLPDPDPDAVAYHFQHAGDPQAVEWLVRAGERAQRSYADVIAAARYEIAIGLLERDRTRLSERGWLLYRLGVLCRRTESRRGIAHLDEAARIASQIGDDALAAGARFMRAFCRGHAGEAGSLPELAAGVEALEHLSLADHARLNAQDGLATPSESKPWRGTLVFSLALRGHFSEAAAMGERFVATSPAPAAGEGLRAFAYGGAYFGLGIAYALLGRPARAHEAFASARATFDTNDDPLNLAWATANELRWMVLPFETERAAAYRNLAYEAAQAAARAYPEQTETMLTTVPVLFVTGEWTDARALLAAGIRTAGRPTRLFAQSLLVQLAWAQGDPNLAWEQIRAALPDGPEIDPDRTYLFASATLPPLAVKLALDARDLPLARVWLEAHERWLASSGAVLGQSEQHLLWAEYHRAEGDIETADRSAEQALAHASEPRQPLALLAAHRLLGELNTDAGHFSDAGRHLNASLVLADACAAPFERALTLFALAQLHAAAGRRADAGTLLDEVRAICSPLGARPTLDRADSLAVRLAATTDAPPVYPAGLSAREVEVLRLLASGKTNREMAETLFLSERTIDAHVRNIFIKTRTDNRAAATAFAYQHRLA